MISERNVGGAFLLAARIFHRAWLGPEKGRGRVEKSRCVGDEVHLASRWKGCSIRGKSEAGEEWKGTRLGTATSRNGANPSFRFVSFGREKRYKGRTMEKGNSCWSKA